MSNGQVCVIRREVECHSFSVIYSLECKMRNEKETYIEKTIEDTTKGLKVRISQHVSDCKAGISACKFPRHVYDCGIKNNCLQEPFFSLNIMLQLNKSDKLETIEEHFHLKGYDTMNKQNLTIINLTNQISINLLSSASLKERSSASLYMHR